MLEDAAEAQEIPIPPTKGFVISLTRRGKHRKLHCVQACRFLPDVHYRAWKALGELLPEQKDFDSVCSFRHPGGALAPEEPEISGSSSSSSGEDERASKRQRPAEAGEAEGEAAGNSA